MSKKKMFKNIGIGQINDPSINGILSEFTKNLDAFVSKTELELKDRAQEIKSIRIECEVTDCDHSSYIMHPVFQVKYFRKKGFRVRLAYESVRSSLPVGWSFVETGATFYFFCSDHSAEKKIAQDNAEYNSAFDSM